MIYKIKGSGATHSVDTQAVTCTCMDFKMRHRNVFGIFDNQRYCKHLQGFKGEIGILHMSLKTQEVSGRPVGPNSHKGKHARNVIQILQEQIVNWMTECPTYHSVNFEFCGSWRRGAMTIGDIDLLISDESENQFIQHFKSKLDRESDEVLLDGPKKSSYVIEGIQVDVRIIPAESWGAALCHFTGPMEENIRLRKIAKDRGYSLSEYGLKVGATLHTKITTEREIYNMLGETYLEPNQR
jgi:DNA polymerase/3'-5' exonuclease PolX